ncbi:hypothetical protein AOQ84DRAFT_300325, partial [Glonium stellatum]
TKPEILGVGRVVSYKDLQKARAKRAAKATPTAEEANLSKGKCGRGRKGAALEHEAGDIERRAKLLRTSDTQVKEVKVVLKPYRAPEAKMY